VAVQEGTMNSSSWDWAFCQEIERRPLWHRHKIHNQFTALTHHHLGVEFIYCRSGQGSFDFGTHSFPYKAPMIIHFQAMIPHAVHMSGTYERWNICLEPSTLQLKLRDSKQPSLNQIFNCTSGISFIQTPIEYLDRLETLFDDIGYEIDNRQLFYEDIVFYRLQELLAITKRLTSIGSNNDSAVYPSKVTSKWEMEEIVDLLTYIEANLSEDLSARTLAERFHFSEQHFYRAIRKMTGKSLNEYIKHRRIERAKGLLTSTGLSITGIAETVGLPDPAQFSRTFRSLAGCTPSQFRLNDI